MCVRMHVRVPLCGIFGFSFKRFETVAKNYPKLLDPLRALQKKFVRLSGLGDHYLDLRRQFAQKAIDRSVSRPSDKEFVCAG